MVEQWTVNPPVAGSSPARIAKQKEISMSPNIRKRLESILQQAKEDLEAAEYSRDRLLSMLGERNKDINDLQEEIADLEIMLQ